MTLFEAFLFCIVCFIGLIVATVAEALMETRIQAEETVWRLFRKHNYRVTDRQLIDSLDLMDYYGGQTLEAWEARYASRP